MSAQAWENLLESVTAVREFHKRWFERTRDQVLAGEPFAICNGDEIEEVLNLMGIPVLIMNNWNYEIIAHKGEQHFSQLLRDRGYPGEHMFALGYASSLDPGGAPWGGLPRPSVIVSGGKYEMELRVSELWARHHNCPLYAMDFMFSTPFKALPPEWWKLLRDHWDQLIDPHRLQLRVEQEKAFIRFMEQQTGRTFSLEALVRAMSLINDQMDLWNEAQALIARTRPCPVSVRDQMRVYQAMWHRGTPQAVEMIGNYLAEIKARVANGVAAHPGERIRLFYNGRVPPWHQQIARRYGAVTVACSYTGIPDLYARNMHDGDPFPAMASRHVFLFAQGPDRIIDVARAHQCDAVIGIEANMRAEYPSIEQTQIEAAGLPYLAVPRDSDDPDVLAMVSNFIEQRLLRAALLMVAWAMLFIPQMAAKATAAEAFDTVIVNGHIIDGTGSPWYTSDLGIRDGHIKAIGNLATSPRRQTIDAGGRVVAPGFIDMLGQSELTILVDPRLPSKIYQGITTEITGEGESVAPLNDRIIAGDGDFPHLKITPDWRTFQQYFARLERQGIGINLASYIGATTARRMVLGDADVQPTEQQLTQMRLLVRQAMQEGAVGLSTALQYAPAPYAKTEELIALAGEAARFGGIYATHMRSEGDAEAAAIDEAVRIGREAHIPVEIWHLKAAGKANWGKMPQLIAQIEAARASGIDISANTYAYTAWFNTFSAFIPPWAHDGGDAALLERLKDPAMRARIRHDLLTPAGDWDNEWQYLPGPEAIQIAVVHDPALRPLQGKRLSEVAEDWHEDAIDALCDLLIRDKAQTEVAVFGMSEPDVALALRQPWVSIDNDSKGTSPEGLLGQEHPHPRAYGTFPRILRKYVREEHVLGLEDAIRKFTALPAQRMRLSDRGVIKQGMWADLVIFDPATIRDLATFEQPNQLSEGMQYVLVNGVAVIADGKMTGARPGKVLRGRGYTGT